MAYLYLDTASNFTFGILDNEFQWVTFKRIETKRTSDLAHVEINKALEEKGLSVKNLDAVINLAGPGSYTGMRVAEGISQILELEGIKTYSFTALRIPEILEIKNYAWISSAFKKETFVKTRDEQFLIADEQLLDFRQKSPELHFVTHYKDIYNDVTALELELENNPKKIFAHVVDNSYRDKPFYYRSLEKEFKKSSK